MSTAHSASWKSSFTSVPPLTKFVATAMTVMTALDFALRFRDLIISGRETEDSPYVNSEAALIPLLAVVPASAPYRFWTFASASFYERGIFQYVMNTLIFLGSGKYLERSWGSREFLKFLCVSSIGPMIAVYFTCLIGYVIHVDDGILYDTRVHGMTSVISGIVIAFKHLVPEHLTTIWGVFSIRVKFLPLLFAIYMTFEGFVLMNRIHFMLAIYGLFMSWIYLRFIRVQNGIRGDRSETFSFASFFPEPLQPPVKAFSNMCFEVLVKLHICSPTFGGIHYSLENPQMAGMGHTFTQPGSLRAEAERRRALALKALDMRLHTAAGLKNTPFSGAGRSAAGSSQGAPVSLLSLSAGPLPTIADEEEDEVLFESTIVDMGESTSSTPPPSLPPTTTTSSSHPSKEPGSQAKTDREKA
ncbi:eukaryotic integral membrane protein-domain-containing protein [Mortierella sp. GBAus27b]|nr:eukaryotic integral membrane protein-domain-containing protein [Mortierella sp. GBAus27b]